MPNTPDNRKIISLAALSEFKTLLIQDFNGRYVPYSGADASVNLGANNFITSSYFEARSVSSGVINAYTRYRAGSVVVEDASAQNTKIINFPTASNLENSNTFATQEWGLSNLLRLDIGGIVKGNIDVTPETTNRHIAVNSPTDSQSNSYAMLDTFYEDSYAYSELVLSGMSGITRYRRDYIQVGDYKISFPTLTEDSVFALDGQYLPLTGGGLTGSLSITNETATGFHNAVLTYRTKQGGETDPNSFDITVNEARIPRPLWTTYRFIYDSSASGTQHVASREWVEGQGYTSNQGTVIGSGLTANAIVLGNGTVNIKTSSYKPGPSGTTWDDTSDVFLPTMKSVKNYVTSKGYTTNQGTVTSVAIGVGTGLAVDNANAITTSGTRTISIASGYKLPTTTEWNAKANSTDLGSAAAKNYTTSVTSGSSDLVTSGAVFTAIANLPTPMQFKGTLGVGGTISVLPDASASNNGYTYKVISNITTLNAKVGDVFVSNGTSWVLIPSGDDVEDTWREIYVNDASFKQSGISSGKVNFKSGSNVTIRADGDNITISSSYTNSYHKTGSWSGLTYTAKNVNTNDNLVFTIPTGTTASTVALGNHNHDSVYLGINAKAADSNKLNGQLASYYAIATHDHDSRYLKLSGGTMTGMLTVKSPIFGYEYNVSNNNAAFILDKPGSNYSGIGSHAETDTIYFGACGSTGAWVDTYKQKWKFNGTIIEDGTALADKYLGKTAKAADSDLLDGQDSTYYLNYNNLTNKPTIPTVSNATITIKQAGQSDQTFTLNGSATTITLADTNTHNTHKIISGYKQDGTTQIISASASNGNIELGASGITAGWYKRVYVNAKGIVVNGDQTDADANTWRPIKYGSTTLNDTSTTLEFVAGSNVQLSFSSGKLTISATDTTYESKAEASGGTAVSLVTTGEKYTWNHKSNLALVSSGGNNGTATTAARSDHTHAVAVAETLDSNDVPISGTGSSGFMSAHDKTTIDRLENGFWYGGEWDWGSFSIIDLNEGQIFRRKTVYQPTVAVYETHFKFPQANSNSIETFATQEWVRGQGYTTNAGTVTSVRVQAGTGLSSSQSTAQTETLNTTISIASGYKLPTTDEWSAKLDMSDVFGFGDDVMEAFIDGNYPSFIKLVNDGNGNPKFAFDTTNYSVVSGANDGTNWTSITINGVTKNIPSGGSGSLTLDNVSDGTTRKLNQVTAATGKAKLGVKTVGVKPNITGQGYLELSDSSVSQGTTTYYRDRIVYGSKALVLPTRAGVLALVGDIKHLYKHWVIFNVYSDISFKFEFYSTSTTSSSTLTAANLLQMLQGKIVGAVNNNSGSSVMLSVHQAIQANTYQGFIYYVGGSYVEFYPFAVNVTYVTIEDSGYEEV